MQNITNGQFCIQVIYTRGMLQICSYCTDTNFAIFIIYRCRSCTLNGNKRNKDLKSMRDENCKRAAAAARRSVRVLPSLFAFPMLRCTAPEERTPRRAATTSPPWPLCCPIYCSVLACLRRDYLCGRDDRKRLMLAPRRRCCGCDRMLNIISFGQVRVDLSCIISGRHLDDICSRSCLLIRKQK